MFENEKVNHVKFGEGSVMECDGSHIRIVFSYNNVEKTFAYPGAFDKFVTFQSKEAQQAAESELEQIRLNQKKLGFLGFFRKQAKKLEGMKKLIIQENERRKEEALKAKAKRKRQ